MTWNSDKSTDFENGVGLALLGPKMGTGAGDPITAGLNPPNMSIYFDTTSSIHWIKNGSSSADWIPAPTYPKNYITTLVDDFVSASTTGSLGWTETTTGAGGLGGSSPLVSKATDGIDNTSFARGVMSLASGGLGLGASNGIAALTLDVASTTLLGWSFRTQFRTRLANLSTSGDRYEFTCGYLSNIANTADHANGAYFKYNDSVSANVQCVTANNSTRTTTTTSVAMTTAWTRFSLLTSLTDVKFYIDGNLVATHTTNIPNANNRLCGPGVKILKTAGATSRIAYFDYFHEEMHKLTSR